MKPQRSFQVFVNFIIVVGTLVFVLCAAHLATNHLNWHFLVLLALMAGLAARLSISIPYVKGEVTVGDTLIFLTMLLYGSAAAVVIAAVDGLISSCYVSKKPRVLLFNSAQMAFSTFVTAATVQYFFGPPNQIVRMGYSLTFIGGISVMFFVQYLTNSGMVATYTALKTGNRVFATWRTSYLWTSISYLAGASVAGLAAHFLPQGLSIYTMFMVMPVVAITYITYKTYLSNVNSSVVQAEQAKRHAELLEESEQRFRSAFHFASIGMALVSESGNWLQVNRSLCQLLGYEEDELLQTDIQSLTHPDDLGELLVQQSRLTKGQVDGYQAEKRYIHKSGAEVWTLVSVSRVRDPETKLLRFIFQIQDISDRKRAEAQLVHDAFHDALTGLPNRALFVDHLKLAIARQQRREYQLFSVLFFDLDRFKIINDSLGHLIGDQLLVAMAQRIQGCLRPGDTVARLGGDEFTILLEDLKSIAEAIHIAERIQRELSAPFDLEGRQVFTSASIGIAPSTSGYDRPDHVLRDADTAMYYAKSLGGSRYQVFDKSMHVRAVKLLEMQSDLRQAIEKQELFVEYQPIVSLDTFRIVGFEALARWNHSVHGLISPGQFIPVAEDTGLILPIGQWILREACKQARDWQEIYFGDEPLSMSVNLSGKQFAQSDLISLIKEVLAETGLHPKSLKLEITESVVVENVEAASEMLAQLRSLGVGLSIDDFGTGYSSLSSLHRFPISTLKIDSSFVSRMNGNNENTEIVKTIMSLAGNLGMDVTAEGVETLEQVTRLRSYGCPRGQGFFFSRPVSAAAARALLNESAGIVPNMHLADDLAPLEAALVA
jgi:diguanylate cyclase (GGDEF)-like protein/PAS domain S-box-containing protein